MSYNNYLDFHIMQHHAEYFHPFVNDLVLFDVD